MNFWGRRRGTGLAAGDPGARSLLCYRLRVNSPQTEGSRDFKGKWGGGEVNKAPPGLEEGFSGSSDGKESACNVGNPALIPGSGRSPGEGPGNPLQYSCLENLMDRGAQWAAVPGVAKSWT